MKTIYYYQDGSWSTQHKGGTTRLDIPITSTRTQVQNQVNDLLTFMSL